MLFPFVFCLYLCHFLLLLLLLTGKIRGNLKALGGASQPGLSYSEEDNRMITYTIKSFNKKKIISTKLKSKAQNYNKSFNKGEIKVLTCIKIAVEAKYRD